MTTRRTWRRGKTIQFVGQAHLELLVAAGGLPVPVPAIEGTLPHLDEVFAGADGLLLTEGGDVSPAYRRTPTERPELLEELDPVKDAIDLGLVERAHAAGVPVLGICRGSELLALALGGTLYEDLVSELPGAYAHVSQDDYDGYRHPVELVPGTPLAQLYRDATLSATSYHHQGVRTLPSTLRPMAFSGDGLLEAFHDPAADFFWGLQFHPERQLDEHPRHREVHAAFVAATRRHAATRGGARACARPSVLVPMRRDVRKGRPIQFVHETHLEELLAGGVVAQPVPALAGLVPAAAQLAEESDGLLLVEGGDIGGDRHPVAPDRLAQLREIDPARDAIEVALCDEALARHHPILGTCRGAQLLNVISGGTLHVHLPDDVAGDTLHIDPDRYDEHRHRITLAESGPLTEIYEDVSVEVTSVHHQGIDRLADRFRPLAWAPDGLVEAFDDPAHPFLLAVQHHPERQLDEHHGHRGLYRRFADAVVRRRAGRGPG